MGPHWGVGVRSWDSERVVVLGVIVSTWAGKRLLVGGKEEAYFGYDHHIFQTRNKNLWFDIG